MRRARNSWRAIWIGAGLVLAIAVTTGTSPQIHGLSWFGSKSPGEYATTPVCRTNLDVTLVAGGRVDSAEKTIIECQLEAMAGMPWGNSTIISIVPEGTVIKKGDVLCSLDSSRYDESLRLQEIHVGQVRADLKKAELDHQVAKLAVVEYREGLMQESLTALKGEIALLRADHERAGDRLGWARRMHAKGYVSRRRSRPRSPTSHILSTTSR